MEAVKIQKKDKRTRADEAIEQISMLYLIEHELKNVAQEESHVARQTRSMPVLAQLRIWLDKTRPPGYAEPGAESRAGISGQVLGPARALYGAR